MEKFVMYITKKGVGLCLKKHWQEYVYYKEIKPLEIVVVGITKQAENAIFSLLQTDEQAFVDIIRQELEDNLLKINSN